MSDIGRSTVSHIDRHEINYAQGHEALDNYGAWHRAADDGTRQGIVQPMFREIKQGYRTLGDLRTTYDEDYAIEVDRLMAKILKKPEITIVFCRYVHAMSTRVAATSISRGRDRVTANEYALRLEAVVARVDMALYMIGLDNG